MVSEVTSIAEKMKRLLKAEGLCEIWEKKVTEAGTHLRSLVEKCGCAEGTSEVISPWHICTTVKCIGQIIFHMLDVTREDRALKVAKKKPGYQYWLCSKRLPRKNRSGGP